jgi:alpha-beta hydrolase superfamily lysophospholipase
MKISEWYWESSDGNKMFGRSWAPDDQPKAMVLLVHGLGEHICRYDHVAAAMTAKGYILAGFDLRGHGKSGGPRGHIPSYQALMDDITEFIKQAETRFPGLPRFLYGHSLGGNLVINYVLRCNPNVQGVLATGPWLELAFQPPASQVRLGKLMNRIFPGFTQRSNLNTKGLSHDQAVVTAYEKDPLVHDKITARMFIDIYESGFWALEHATEFPLHLLLMHGSEDPITSAKSSQLFAEKAEDKVTFKKWDGMDHEIHNEFNQAEVFKVMLDWLDGHL